MQNQSIMIFNIQNSDSSNGGVNGGVNFLLKTIKLHPGQRTGELSKLLSMSAKTCEKWITKLKKQDKIEFHGAPKTGGYFVK